jgi:hypothetical protein
MERHEIAVPGRNRISPDHACAAAYKEEIELVLGSRRSVAVNLESSSTSGATAAAGRVRLQAGIYYFVVPDDKPGALIGILYAAPVWSSVENVIFDKDKSIRPKRRRVCPGPVSFGLSAPTRGVKAERSSRGKVEQAMVNNSVNLS